MAQRVDPDEVGVAYRALEAWRRYEPEVDLYVVPCVAIDLPPEGCDELEVQIPLAAFLLPVNLIGWASLAIGNMQLIAPHDETAPAAGLAWEREYRPCRRRGEGAPPRGQPQSRSSFLCHRGVRLRPAPGGDR